MSDEAPKTEVKWWDKKLLVRSTLVGLAFHGLFWALAERAKPPEGHMFERLPAISGTYKCCEAGGRYSKSWVDGTTIFCLGFSYYQLSTGRDDCGLDGFDLGNGASVLDYSGGDATASWNYLNNSAGGHLRNSLRSVAAIGSHIYP